MSRSRRTSPRPRARLIGPSPVSGIALNLLVLFRSVTQRSDERRAIPWAELIRHVRLALVRTTADDDLRDIPRELAVPTPV